MEEIVYYYPSWKPGLSGTNEGAGYFNITKKDRKILRELAKKKAEIAESSIHLKKINLWKDLNSLRKPRPLIWINEIPWHEMNVNNELTLKTTTTFCKHLEARLRRSIYLWRNMPVDMIVEPTIPCYLVVNSTGFGLSEEVDIARTDKDSDVISRKFTPQIQSEDDIVKIRKPIISLDIEATRDKCQVMKDIFDGILIIEKKGIPGFWFAPWDELIRWWGVQEALTDLILRPKLVHKVMERLTSAYLYMLDQYEDQNLLTLNNGNYRIGSGGLGYTDELPRKDITERNKMTPDLWGSGAAQIFSGVSSSMHYEFSLQYEIRWMKRFGLNYYGCCEPLDKKIEILRKIPNLRKISMSSWVDMERAAEVIENKYVFSYKPNPSIFAENNWDIAAIKSQLKKDLVKIKECTVEIIMKDISTVKYKPQRLWEWAEAAMEVVNGFD